ncbi:DUF3349 domain-containing protein [Allobranchiibius sp. GilTou38]|uniref:DUF3349 domain-containing protein n=1 Tax=Allobranchiibius sp. GilTou38 TaxID=2815210 RepID=UPI001AA1126B|nr:DUF3349 domain-containing protein [Allobranchiibius sp. GilTou38]MBO1766660.1 DUF3349 domain-containing protein [Allobranchiibius sp. GilTou38]
MALNPLTSILDWLRKGYPDGVPPKDFQPLLVLLTRTLSEDELEATMSQVISNNPDGEIRAKDVRDVIAEVKAAPPVEADVHTVAARLAAVGWPLGTPQPESRNGDPATGQQQRAVFVQRVLDWLRAGYPEGVPATDRVPVLALLRRRLSDEEVTSIVRDLIDEADGSSISAVDAQVLITRATNEMPTDEELQRVRARLAAQGWPLDD